MSAKAYRLDEESARVLVARLHKVAGKNIDGLKALSMLAPEAPGPAPSGRALMAKHGRTMQDMTLEDQLDAQLVTLDLPPWERNYQFLGEQLRKFELDWAWPQFKFGLEVDGMVHRTKGRFKTDYDKHVLALLHGWTILRVNGSHVRSGHVAAWLTTLLERYAQGSRR